MKYSTRTGTLSDLTTPCLVTSLGSARQVAAAQGQTEAFQAATADFNNTVGNANIVRLGSKANQTRILIAGGADGAIDAATYQRLVRFAAQSVKSLPVHTVLWDLNNIKVTDRDSYWRACAGLTALSSALYSFAKHKTSATPKVVPRAVQLHTNARARTNVQRAVRHSQALKAGLDLARDLGNQPPNVCTPSYLLREVRKLGREEKVSVTALDEKRMEALGMGAFMAVTKGSTTPGKMIIVQYRGGKRGDAPVALIGKGITFDTGGISLKTPPGMDEMKFDMCGGAAVLGATKAAVAAKLPMNLVTIVAAAENMPNGNATRPGDIVTSFSGKTIEILNTDAEGRLVLCDAITYARRYNPRVVIDVATLTGAIITALGAHASAIFTKDDRLAEDLLSAGESSGDRAWRMPLWEEYQSALASNFADLPNVGGGRGGSSITAACFLSRFADNLTWAHMDIAGTAYLGGGAKGSTGRPTTLLFRYLADQAGV